MEMGKKTGLLKRPIMTGAAAIALGFAAFGAGQILSPQNINAQAIKAQAPAAASALPSFADLVERVSPAVVAIEVSAKTSTEEIDELSNISPEARKFFGIPDSAKQRVVQGAGSGFFISEDGYIVTNNHVVEGAQKITVTLKDGRELEAKVIGTDARTDIAVIKVSGSKFRYVQFEPNTNIRVGDWVVAIGNPFGLGGTATAGIVSAVGREDVGRGNISEFIQIDAPINPGNSGGPTFDMAGRVIGVNTAIVSKTGGNVGIGFAVPAKTVSKVTNDIIKNGGVKYGWIGVAIGDLNPELADSYGLSQTKGAIIGAVTNGAPAAKGGLKRGDVVIAVDNNSVTSSSDLTRKIGAVAVGSTIKLDVVDGSGKKRVVNITVAARPDEKKLAEMSRFGVEDNTQANVETTKSLGLSIAPLSEGMKTRLKLGPQDNGVIIADVAKDSKAEEKGISKGDAILLVNSVEIASPTQFVDEVAKAKKEGRKFVRIYIVTAEGQSGFQTLPIE
jgi:serine protease Do